MILSSDSIEHGKPVPGNLAFCIPDSAHHVCLGANRNPHMVWSDIPSGTLSFAVIVHDPDVPSVGDDVNQEGRTVPATLPRTDFFHWVLFDLPASCTSIWEAEFSSEVTPKGKTGPATLHGAKQGINDYTAWFAADGDMQGNYYGYDGPCPPWNDEIIHRYVFSVFALDVASLGLEGKVTGQQLRSAMVGHVLAEASLTCTYTLNPTLFA